MMSEDDVKHSFRKCLPQDAEIHLQSYGVELIEKIFFNSYGRNEVIIPSL